MSRFNIGFIISFMIENLLMQPGMLGNKIKQK